MIGNVISFDIGGNFDEKSLFGLEEISRSGDYNIEYLLMLVDSKTGSMKFDIFELILA